MKNKYLVALPSFKSQKGFNCQTVLVSAIDKNDAVNLVYHLKGKNIIIGDIKKVDY